MRVVDGELAFLHEVDVAEWLGIEAAAARLTYERDRELLAAAVTASHRRRGRSLGVWLKPGTSSRGFLRHAFARCAWDDRAGSSVGPPAGWTAGPASAGHQPTIGTVTA